MRTNGFVWKKQLSAISIQHSAHDDQSGRAARADGNRVRVARGKNMALDHPEKRQDVEKSKPQNGRPAELPEAGCSGQAPVGGRIHANG